MAIVMEEMEKKKGKVVVGSTWITAQKKVILEIA